ncbi:MAG: SpoIIE family protein phosphatase [Cellvibrionales bacterium]|nr:SpoIIE family protein phosphatase [Cellvibrionales bacterium]
MRSQGLRIFSLDQDPQARRLIARYLSRRGHRVCGFASLQDLAQCHERSAPDIVICNIDLCDKTEQQVAQRYPKKKQIQYIQLIREHPIEHVVEAFQHPNRDCLPYPFTERTLILATERAKERRLHLARNLRIQRRLKKAMEQAENRLSILQADQIAGRQMQQSLLPASPVIAPPYYMARQILPSLYLSGDFINYMPALGDYLLFYLMDVSGHGASSAFVTVMVRQLMRRIVRRQVAEDNRVALDHAPEGFLEAINTVLADNEVDKHLTMFSGCLDRRTNTLRYAVGAQLPMPVLITAGKAEFLAGSGRPVGLFSDGDWAIIERQLPAQFILIAFTDGILEILPPGSLAEKESYLLERLKSCPPDIEQLLPCLEVEVPTELPDDIGIFMLTRGYH